jgi:hypothetical protein
MFNLELIAIQRNLVHIAAELTAPELLSSRSRAVPVLTGVKLVRGHRTYSSVTLSLREPHPTIFQLVVCRWGKNS